MSDWQPIETAPKDGTHILAHGKAYAELAARGDWITHDPNNPMVPYTAIIFWHELWYDKEIPVGDGSSYRKEPTLSASGWFPHTHAFSATHWMPLPEPPAL